MDGLSLLCNLHADGPLALRRLRAAGAHDLGDLEGLPESTLSSCLRSSPGHARRFVEEARQLALRLAESSLEPEPSGEEGGWFPLSSPKGETGKTEKAEPPTLGGGAGANAPRSAGAGRALRPGLIAGLEERTCERLAAQGGNEAAVDEELRLHVDPA